MSDELRWKLHSVPIILTAEDLTEEGKKRLMQHWLEEHEKTLKASEEYYATDFLADLYGLK